MGSIEVTIVTPDGRRVPVDLPGDARIDRILPVLVKRLGLPSVGGEGRVVIYRLRS